MDLGSTQEPKAGEFPPKVRLVGIAESTVKDVETAYAAARGAPNDAKKVGELGMAYYSCVQEPMAASECFRRAARLDPKSAAWPYYLGLAYQGLYDDEKAAGAYQQALSIDPQYAPIMVALASVIQEKEPARAISLYRRSISLCPRDARAYVGLGRLAAKATRNSDAIRLFREALDIAPRFGQAHLALAEALESDGKHREAETHKREAQSGQSSPLVNDPLLIDLLLRNRNPDYLISVGRRLVSAGDYDTALRIFRRALEESPKNHIAREQIGVVLAMAGRLQEAADHFRALLKQDRSDSRAQTQLARVLVDMGQYDEAAKIYEDVLSYRPEDSEILAPAGMLQLALGHRDAATPLFERLATLRPNDASAQMDLAVLLVCKRDYGQAIAGYKFAQGLMPNPDEALSSFLFELLRLMSFQRRAIGERTDAKRLTFSELSGLSDRFRTNQKGAEANAFKSPLSAAVEIVMAWARKGEYQRALSALDGILPIDERGQLAIAKGSIFALQQRYPEAEHWFSEALKADPHSAAANANLGAALVAMKRNEEAVKVLETALKDDPQYVDAQLNLGLALAGLQRLDDAEQTYRKLVQNRAAEAKAWDGLGDVALRRGKLADAVSHLEKAAALAPQDGDVLLHLGIVLVRAERPADAIKWLQKAAAIGKGDSAALAEAYGQACMKLSMAARSRRDHGEVVRILRDGLSHTDESAVLANALAWTLATCPDSGHRNAAEAIRWASSACQQTEHQNAGCLDTLAAAYAEAGRFAEAIGAEELAIKLAKATKGGESDATAYGHRLDLYKSKKPFRDDE